MFSFHKISSWCRLLLYTVTCRHRLRQLFPGLLLSVFCLSDTTDKRHYHSCQSHPEARKHDRQARVVANTHDGPVPHFVHFKKMIAAVEHLSDRRLALFKRLICITCKRPHLENSVPGPLLFCVRQIGYLEREQRLCRIVWKGKTLGTVFCSVGIEITVPGLLKTLEGYMCSIDFLSMLIVENGQNGIAFPVREVPKSFVVKVFRDINNFLFFRDLSPTEIS